MKKLGDIHPILFAAYPILFLFSKNLGLVSLGQIVVPMGISVVAVLLLWLGLSFVLKDKTKAGIMASALLVLSFSYGHLFNLAGNKVVAGIDLGQHKYVFPAWGLLVILLSVVLWRTRGNLRRVADVLNIMSAALVVITMATALLGLIGGGGTGERAEAGPVGSQEPERQPDIYYVILDGRARAGGPPGSCRL